MLLQDENKPRRFWNLARVKDLVVGRDGLTRGAILGVASPGERAHGTILQRPLQKLYPLEITGLTPEGAGGKPDHTSAVVAGTERDTKIQNHSRVSERPIRAAAVRARDRSKALAMYEQDKWN